MKSLNLNDSTGKVESKRHAPIYHKYELGKYACKNLSRQKHVKLKVSAMRTGVKSITFSLNTRKLLNESFRVLIYTMVLCTNVYNLNEYKHVKHCLMFVIHFFNRYYKVYESSIVVKRFLRVINVSLRLRRNYVVKQQGRPHCGTPSILGNSEGFGLPRLFPSGNN